METQRHTNGWSTCLEHWGWAISCIVGMMTLECLFWITQLRGASWVRTYYAAVLLGSASVGALLYAKWPLYRRGRFLVLGVSGLSRGHRRAYRVGLALAVVALLLLLCLLLAHP